MAGASASQTKTGGASLSNWSFALSWPLLLLGCILWVASLLLCIANIRRAGAHTRVRVLEVLRLLLITLLILTLFRPEFIRHVRRSDPAEIAVLYDSSRSMETRDLVVSNYLMSRADWLQDKLSAPLWRPLEAKVKLRKEPFSSSGGGGASATNHGTDINSALEKILAQQSHLKGVLLLTDGDWNTGRTPLHAAARFREENVPIYSVAIGRETPLPDLSLADAALPSYGLFGEQITIPFKVVNTLPTAVKTEIQLLDGDREEVRKEITIPANGKIQDALLWYPKSVGQRALSLKLPVAQDEIITENNSKAFSINVRVETLKVLVIDSLPRWEYRYLRNALMRDPGVEMHSLLLHPGMSPGGGRNYLSSFPNSRELISRYDVIFLGDVGIGENELAAADLELIKGLVEQQSSGLVLLPGRRGRQQTLLDSPLKDLFPVILDPRKPDGIGLQNEASLQLSSTGRGHLLTRFDADEQRNDELWKQLPGFFWSAAVEKSRPGSEVLGVHSALRNASGRMPLLVIRPFGNGKVLFLGTDSAWRWRRGVEDKFHYRFWSQVVRWMAHQRHLADKNGIRLSYSPETPSAGDTLLLQANVFDNAGFPLEKGTVYGQATSPSGRSESLQFEAVEGGWGLFRSSFSTLEGGRYKLAISALGQERQLETEIEVTQPEVEKLGQPANAAILKQIAEMTGGQSGAIETFNEMVTALERLPEPRPREERIRLWSNPWWGGLLLSLLAIYWTGRKLAGMV